MNLKTIIEELLASSQRADGRALGAIAQAEFVLQQAYEGRYFFELIQNARDAHKLAGIDGPIYIDISNGTLSISNSGAEFNRAGVESITTIGQSPKAHQDLVGFKGIGFKAIQEITTKPSIITKHGTIVFDRSLTNQNVDGLKASQRVPLFYFPYYQDTALDLSDTDMGIVTKIVLPLKEGINEQRIIQDFEKIQAKQLILLGNIKSLQLRSDGFIRNFRIEKNPARHTIQVIENDTEVCDFKVFSPAQKFQVPTEVLDSLEGKEKELFASDPEVDVTIVVELNGQAQIIPIEDSQLYLFYPLQITSGFKFLIHSYFIVNPERVALRSTPLNDFILKKIAEFIGNEMLASVQKQKINTTKLLCFKRVPDAKLDILYDTVVLELKNKKFIYDTLTKKYFSPDDVIVADGFDKGLFLEGKIAGRQLIYIGDEVTIQWLRGEFSVPYLDYDTIAAEIETECRKQLKKKNIGYFQNLYNYVKNHERLNLSGKKVLLTDQWRLVSSEEDVFYIGKKQNRIKLTKALDKQIKFLHPGIKISDIRDGKSRTGIVEYSKYELVRRLLKLFNKPSVPNADIVNILFELDLDQKSEIDVVEKILLPIKDKNQWLQPQTNPIYIESKELKILYPGGNFVDETVFTKDGKHQLKMFLQKVGAWTIPAVYISEKYTTIPYSNDSRNDAILRISGLTSKPYYLKNDRILDKPVLYNVWFTLSVINNWNTYQHYIKTNMKPLQYASASSYFRSVTEDQYVGLSSFAQTLKTANWIVLQGEQNGHRPDALTTIEPLDFNQPTNHVIRKYLNLLPLPFESNRSLLNLLSIPHLDGDSLQNYVRLLQRIHTAYSKQIIESDFAEFYNRIISKLYDYYYYRNVNNNEQIQILGKLHFLAFNDVTKAFTWEIAEHMFYLDDKPNYDLLPFQIKERVQPQFTKHDRNTFGKIAAKIGRRFSRSVSKELIQQPVSKSALLPEYFSFLPESLALLEFSLDILITRELDLLKTIKVFELPQVRIKIGIANEPGIELDVPHFIDRPARNIYLSTTGHQNRNRQIADAMTELFIQLLEREPKKYNTDLFRFLNTDDKRMYLHDYDISPERINEIRERLTASAYAPDQKFWLAVMSAKNINYDVVVREKETDYPAIAGALLVSEEQIHEFRNEFDFTNTSDPAHLDALVLFFGEISLPLEKLNRFLFPRINYNEHYSKHLKQLKNRFYKTFEALLHNHFAGQDISRQQDFQDLLDHYKYSYTMVLPENTLGIHVETVFVELTNRQYPYLHLDSTALNSEQQLDTVGIYSKNKDLMIAGLSSFNYKQEMLHEFLSPNKVRSLLYFNRTKEIIATFTNWVTLRHKEAKKDIPESNEELRSYFDMHSTSIESVTTQKVDVSPGGNGNGSSGGGGNRYDGASKEHIKHLVGVVAEMAVYQELSRQHGEVTWVSKNAAKVPPDFAGYNPEGSDGLGYDIEYLDPEGNKVFVEVKGKIDSFESFEVTKREIEKAATEKDAYKILFVTNTLDNVSRRIRDLGNLFLYEEGYDFFFNNRFTPIYKNFEIRFK